MTIPTRNYLITQYQNIYEGPTWYGPALKNILADIPKEVINYAPHIDAFSIGHLLKHSNNWQDFVLRKMSGEEQFEIDEVSEANFPKTSKRYSEAEFEQLRLTNFSQYKNILTALESKSETWLSEITPGKNYPNWELVQGIIHHDLYHFGQIRMLVKIAEKVNR